MGTTSPDSIRLPLLTTALECGAAATEVRTVPDCIDGGAARGQLSRVSAARNYRCTPQSVAPYTLYENADPFELKESSGTLLTNNARYEAISDRAVRVSGSEFVQDPEYTIKLEGMRHIGYFDDPHGRGARLSYPEPNRQFVNQPRTGTPRRFWIGPWQRTEKDSLVGSQSAPIGTPTCRQTARQSQRLVSDSSGVPLRVLIYIPAQTGER
jgi:hypothetical protein